MECLPGHIHTSSYAIGRRFLLPRYRTPHREYRLRAERRNDQNDSVLQSAIDAASLRFHESNRPEPLFVDHYAGCLVEPNIEREPNACEHHYCLATKVIDDKLLQTVNKEDGPKQVVLFTDGMDTRPYRLSWPSSTMIYDISPGRVFEISAEKLQGVGAKIPRTCLLSHVPIESPNIQETLRSKGFNGNRPSIWAIQGLPLRTLASFEAILSVVSGLGVKESLFIGEFPACLAETENRIKLDVKKWMDKLFSREGLKVEAISYDEVARSLGREIASRRYDNMLFLAQQLRFSDDQMGTWRQEFLRIEEEGDEEGFEEL